MAVIEFTSAASGTGKTFRRCAHFISEDWLPNYEGVHFSNFPISPDRLDKMLEYVCEKYPRLDRETLRKRVHIIPHEVTEKWRQGVEEYHEYVEQEKGKPIREKKYRCFGPWDYFEKLDISGAWIAIDEIHHYVNTKSPKVLQEKWRAWLGELRHRKIVTCEFISQYEKKVATCIRHEAGLQRTLWNSETRYNPFFGGTHKDWLELKAGLMGEPYSPVVYEWEIVEMNGKKVEQKRINFRLGEPYYSFYDSYSAPIAGGVVGSGDPYVYNKLSRKELLLRFARKNKVGLSLRFLGVIAFVWFLCGGGSYVTTQFMRLFTVYLPHAVAMKQAEKMGTEVAIAATPGHSPVVSSGDVREISKEDFEKPGAAGSTSIHSDTSYRIVLMQPLKFSFANGETYTVGDVIDHGKYQGRTVTQIDFHRLFVKLDSEVVWLGR